MTELDTEGKLDTAMQAKIAAKICGFDAVALLQLLEELGVTPLQIRYRGHRSSIPQPTLLHKIKFSWDFKPGKQGHVVIKVNLGLVSCRSPLPSYLLAMLKDEERGELLRKVLDFLDNKLVGERLASFRPELDRRLVPDWDHLRSDMLGLTSKLTTSRLHWIFQLIYPQIGVCVRRVPMIRSMEAPEVQLGSGKIGAAVFGGEAAVSVHGLEVTLICEDPLTYTLDPWTVEARRRLVEQVYPVLCETGIHLTVVLLFLERAADAAFDEKSHLDYSPLPGGSPGPTRIVLFSGPAAEIAARIALPTSTVNAK